MNLPIFAFFVVGVVMAEEKEAKHEKRGLEDLAFGGFDGVYSYGDAHGTAQKQEHLKTIIITKEIKVPVPQPYPVEVIKRVPYPVKVPVQVKVIKPYPVEVPRPYPVYVEKKIPYPVEKKIPYPVKVPYEVPVPVKVPVHIPKPYPVHVPKPVPVPHPVYIEKKVPIYTKKLESYGGFEGLNFESDHGQFGYFDSSY